MAYAFKSKKSSRGKFGLKKPRTPITAYRYAITPKNVILWIIAAVATIICIATLSVFLLNPERRVRSDFETLATNYYENVFYQGILTSDNFSGDIEKALEKYTTTGLSRLTLRQLSLLSPSISPDYLLTECDENDTFVTFFPEPPYSRNSYRAEYVYSCNF